MRHLFWQIDQIRLVTDWVDRILDYIEYIRYYTSLSITAFTGSLCSWPRQNGTTATRQCVS